MNKILFFFATFSLILNLYQYLNQPTKISSLKNYNKSNDKKDRTKSITKNHSLTNCEKEKLNSSIKTNLTLKKGDISGFEKMDDEETDYDQISENTKNDIETFIIRDLNFSISETSEVFDIISKTEEDFNKHIRLKSKKLESIYSESFGYSYDPEDYILLGQKRLKARELIKKVLGEEKYQNFMKFIQDYNHGKFAESFVPIEI